MAAEEPDGGSANDGEAGGCSGSDSDGDPQQQDTEQLPADEELEAAIAAIRANKDLPRPPYPTLPNVSSQAAMQIKVNAVQSYIEKLTYNFTGVNYFDIRKQRPLSRVLETAREITRQALPIKCIEAVFLGTYLTQGLRELERVPVSFKSSVDGQTYKHIILAIKHNGKWGSIGLSRRRELYFKDMVYDTLADLVLEFKRSYERVFHSLKRIKVGLPLSHDVLAGEYVHWGYVVVKTYDMQTAVQMLTEHGRTAHRLAEQWKNECKKQGTGGAGAQPAVRMPKRSAARKRTPSTQGATEPSESDSSEGEAAASKASTEAKTESAQAPGEAAPTATGAQQASATRSTFLAV